MEVSRQQAKVFVDQYDDAVELLDDVSSKNALRLSAILRYNLLDSPDFLHACAGHINSKLRFTVSHFQSEIDEINLKYNAPKPDFHVSSLRGGPRRVEVNLAEFLKMRPVTTNAKEDSVLEIIKFVANKEGGVHFEKDHDGMTFEKRGGVNFVRIGNLNIFEQKIYEISQIFVEAVTPIYAAIRL